MMNIRTMIFTLTAMLISLSFGQPAAAASKNGDDLLQQCQIDNNLAIIACHIYIHAVQDVLTENTVKGYRVCVPAKLDIDQSVEVIVDWLKRHSNEKLQPASDVVAHALWKKYPCK